MKKNVGILIFDGVEVLDFAGPFEVFAITSGINDFNLFNVFTVSKELKPISAVNDLSVNPKFDLKNCPQIDILIIPGGSGTLKQMEDKEVLNWIKRIHQDTEFTLSICSGSRLLGILGLLDNQKYCTHKEVYSHMAEIVPSGLPQKNKRFVSFGKIYTSAGISAGIDLSFHIVEKLYGTIVKEQTAEYMEYHNNY
ncbi:DJ-1/PfpI family protein [Psychroserpens sp.]